MTKIIGLIVCFVAFTTILLLGISMFSTIPTPESGTEEYETYTNLTSIVNVSITGMQGLLLLFIVIILISMLMYMYGKQR